MTYSRRATGPTGFRNTKFRKPFLGKFRRLPSNSASELRSPPDLMRLSHIMGLSEADPATATFINGDREDHFIGPIMGPIS